MNEQNYTSLKLSKLLAENGFKRESECAWRESKRLGIEFVSVEEFRTFGTKRLKFISEKGLYQGYPAYDILNDLCVRYAKEMFGESSTDSYYHCNIILQKLQQNKKDEAEEYLWSKCLFNPKNK